MDAESHLAELRALRRRAQDAGDACAAASFAAPAPPHSHPHPHPHPPPLRPAELLAPFLRLVREPQVPGPVTGAALASVRRLLAAGAVPAAHPGAPEAANAVVEGATQCRFEAAPAGGGGGGNGADEAVLFGILQVLHAAVSCEAGAHLTDESVCRAYQAAFMLGNLGAGGGGGGERAATATAAATAALLRAAAVRSASSWRSTRGRSSAT